MNNVTIDRTTTNVFISFIFIFLLLGLRIGSDYTSLFILGLTSFLVLLFAILLKYKPLSLKQLWLLTPFLAFQLVYIFNYTSLLHWIIFQFIFILVFFLSANIVWKKEHIKLFTLISYVSIPLLFYFTFVSTDTVNPNTLGGYTFLLSYFPLLYLVGHSKKFIFFRCMLIIPIPLFFIITTGTRSVLLSILFMLLTWTVWKLISKSKIIFNLYFLLITLFCYMYTIIYPNLDRYLTNFEYYDYLMIKYTGKRIHSGRDEIWSTLIDIISLKPWFGYGSGAQPNDFFSTSLSAHNLYLQIALQVGVVGLAFFAIFLFFIWKKFWINRYDKKVILSASFFIGILIYQLSEVSLLQNSFIFALFQWLIIGIGLSYCINQKPKN